MSSRGWIDASAALAMASFEKEKLLGHGGGGAQCTMEGVLRFVDDPADARRGLVVSQSSGRQLIRARAYRAGLTAAARMIVCTVSLNDLSFTASN